MVWLGLAFCFANPPFFGLAGFSQQSAPDWRGSGWCVQVSGAQLVGTAGLPGWRRRHWQGGARDTDWSANPERARRHLEQVTGAPKRARKAGAPDGRRRRTGAPSQTPHRGAPDRCGGRPARRVVHRTEAR